MDHFTGAMRSFISRCRKRNLRVEELGTLMDTHKPINEAEELFLTVGLSVYTKYLDMLAPLEVALS